MSIRAQEIRATFIGCDCNKGFSSFYADGATININVTQAQVYYEVSTGLTGGAENLCSFQNGHEIKVHTGGSYFVTYSISPATASAQPKETEGAIMINNIPSPQGTSHGIASIGGASRPITISGNAVFNLNKDDVISLGVENHTDTTDIVIEHLSCSVVQIH